MQETLERTAFAFCLISIGALAISMTILLVALSYRVAFEEHIIERVTLCGDR